MYGRSGGGGGGLDRFKKAESGGLDPFFSLTTTTNNQSSNLPAEAAAAEVVVGKLTTQVGKGESSWEPPDWAIEPRPGVYYLDVLKDGLVVDRINLDKRRAHIFGRQFPTCHFVLDHQSVSRQHAALVPHRNGSVYVIDMGSVHGTFVANERLSKENPVELEVGQSLRFAASTRSYILRKNNAALFPPPPPSLSDISLPPSPDPCDEDAVLAYNTILNRYCINPNSDKDSERPRKRLRKLRVSFRDQFGGDLVEVVGISDGADVSTEPGPLGVKEGSLVGKYESLVQSTIIPKGGKDPSTNSTSSRGVTDKLQQVLNKVKSGPKTGGIYDDLYGGDALSVSSWAYSGDSHPAKAVEDKASANLGYDNDDLFGD